MNQPMGEIIRVTRARPEPRHFWQGVVMLLSVMFLLGVVMLAVGSERINAMIAFATLLDLLAVVTLAGYAWRRPLRRPGLQVLVFVLAAVQFGRAAIVALVVWPNLVPWQGDDIAWQALWIYAGLPPMVLLAVGLYRYATDRADTA